MLSLVEHEKGYITSRSGPTQEKINSGMYQTRGPDGPEALT